MKKILLIALCLLVATLGITCASAADADNNTISEEPIHTVEQQNTNMMDNVSTEKVIEENINVENNNQQVNHNTNASKLNITGPKINGSKLDIKGPKITGKGPIISISQKQKDIYHYAKLFIQHPELTLFNLCDIVFDECAYNWEETADIVAQAHNIALHKYQGNDMNVSYELTKQGVWDYMSQDMLLIIRHSGRS